mgnify:CR=1 FL=1|jgi:hypothetical protein|nr:MAG TPA: hypothetical protein [Caudoviricetes sp.]DAS37822.1 MAG TPA: hypothetical protein [Caudoviricetes sp.]
MKFTGREEVREAWDSLTTEQKESLESAYRKVLEALKEDGSSPRDITALESLEEYVEACGWESNASAYEDFLEIIEN